MALLIGRKTRMTQVFVEDGVCVPVTVIEAGPCRVTQVKTGASDGYAAVQLGYGAIRQKLVSKPLKGHFGKAGVEPCRVLREERLAEDPKAAPGDEVRVSIFAPGQLVDIIGTSKGHGTQGVMKRHHFGGGKMTHGSMNRRGPGAIGMHTDPARTLPGQRMAGRMGAARITQKNLTVVAVDAEKNLLLVRGSIPGPNGGYVVVRTAKTGVVKKPVVTQGKKKK